MIRYFTAMFSFAACILFLCSFFEPIHLDVSIPVEDFRTDEKKIKDELDKIECVWGCDNHKDDGENPKENESSTIKED